MTITVLACDCCRVEMECAWFQTSDGRMWCQEHGPMALRLQREALSHGEVTFTMPGPMRLWAMEQCARNNRRRFGP